MIHIQTDETTILSISDDEYAVSFKGSLDTEYHVVGYIYNDGCEWRFQAIELFTTYQLGPVVLELLANTLRELNNVPNHPEGAAIPERHDTTRGYPIS